MFSKLFVLCLTTLLVELSMQKKRPVCRQHAKEGSCEELLRRFYYDVKTERCREFIYSGCEGNENNFETKAACKKVCEENPICLQPSRGGGVCAGRYRHYYYDKTLKRCKLFYYGGCGGNDNNSQTKEECEDLCIN